MRNLVLMGLALGACGSPDICDHANSATENSASKLVACSTSAVTTTTSTTFDVSKCKSEEAGCTDSDKSTANSYFSCIENIAAPNCSSSTSDSDKQTAVSTFTAAVATCASTTVVTGISASCKTVFASLAR